MRQTLFYILYFSVFSTFNSFSQEINVEYRFSNNNKANPAISLNRIYLLKLAKNRSICEIVAQNTIHQVPDIKVEEKEEIVRKKLSDDYSIISSKNKVMFYKDYLSDSLIYSTLILTKNVLVKEKLTMFDWEILPTDTTYMDNSCKMAKTNHRGHVWTVFFTDKFGFQGGPWKLDGLPGLILFAITEDSEFVFEASKIEVKNNNSSIINPFVGQKTITWTEYTSTLKEKMLLRVKKLNSMNENGEKDTVIKLGNSIEDLGFKEIRQ
jgi:GLPGLI family protein